MPCHSERSEITFRSPLGNLAQGQRIILQETLRDSSLMLRNEVRWPKGKAMTRCYEKFVAPKFTKNQTISFTIVRKAKGLSIHTDLHSSKALFKVQTCNGFGTCM